jgi:hypothetical protein
LEAGVDHQQTRIAAELTRQIVLIKMDTGDRANIPEFACYPQPKISE